MPFLRLPIIGLAALFFGGSANAADVLLTQYPIASVVAGRDVATHHAVLEQIVAGIALDVPSEEALDPNLIRCARLALGSWGYAAAIVIDDSDLTPATKPRFERADTVVIDLAKAISTTSTATTLTPALINMTKAERIARIDSWLRFQVPAVRETVHKVCGGLTPEVVRNRMRLVLSMQRCPTPSPRTQFHPCNLKGLVGNSRVIVRERAYSQLFAWLQSRGKQPARVWIDLTKGPPGEVVPVSSGLLSIAPIRWPEISIETKIRQFEAQVEYLRSLAVGASDHVVGISAAVPGAIGLTKESAAHVLDLLESPLQAVGDLPSGEQMFSKISDEVARSRIMECVNFNAIPANDLITLGNCAGYKLSASDIARCLNRLRCIPPLAPSGMASVLRTVDRLDLRALALKTALPRVGDMQFDKWVFAARQCGIDNRHVADEEAYKSLATMCAVAKGLTSPNDLATFNCVREAVPHGTEALINCMPRDSKEAGVALQCWREYHVDVVKMTWCAGKSSIPPPVADCIDDYRTSTTGREAMKHCLLRNGSSEYLVHYLECEKSYRTNRTSRAICTILPHLPRELHGIGKCGLTSSKSGAAFAACVASEELPVHLEGDLGQLAVCGVQAGGDPVGTGVCLASGRLNSYQQILVTCGASSGGEPYTFAVCAGGQMLVREFIDCRHVAFGEGHCFGESNEIRRFVLALGLPDISANSVVGKLANGYIDVIKYQFRYAEVVYDLAGDFLKASGEGLAVLGQALEGLGARAEHLARRTGRELRRIGHQAEDVLHIHVPRIRSPSKWFR